MIRVYLKRRTKADGSWEPFLKEILRRDYGIDRVSIARDEFGKPFLEGREMFFNISHSGDLLAAAVSKKPVGVDIERMRPVRDGMYRKVVQPPEQPLIGQDRVRDFIRLWTLKESFTKAEGRGLRISLGAYYFRRENGAFCVYYRGAKAPWTFQTEETIADGYIVSVCGLEREVLFRTE